MINKTEWMDYKRREKIADPTRAEMAMRIILRDELKIPFVEEKRGTKGGICRFYDFFLRKQRIVIEVDGGYHCPEVDTPKEDEIKLHYPEWNLIRFKNEEVLSEPKKVKALIKLAVQDQGWGYSSHTYKRKAYPKKGAPKKAKALLRGRRITANR